MRTADQHRRLVALRIDRRHHGGVHIARSRRLDCRGRLPLGARRTGIAVEIERALSDMRRRAFRHDQGLIGGDGGDDERRAGKRVRHAVAADDADTGIIGTLAVGDGGVSAVGLDVISADGGAIDALFGQPTGGESLPGFAEPDKCRWMCRCRGLSHRCLSGCGTRPRKSTFWDFPGRSCQLCTIHGSKAEID